MVTESSSFEAGRVTFAQVKADALLIVSHKTHHIDSHNGAINHPAAETK